MYCRNCGKEVDPNAAVCLGCGVKAGTGKKFCSNCGEPTDENQAVCLKCGYSLTKSSGIAGISSSSSNGEWYRSADGKILTGVCAGLGKHFNTNPWVIRIISFFIPFGLLIYIVLSIIWPLEE